MKLSDLLENNVIKTKFALKQTQKNLTPYMHNPDIEIPQYDPDKNSLWISGLSKSEPEKFKRFEVEPAGKSSSHIIGIAANGNRIRVSTANTQLADTLADLYNRGGWSQHNLERVQLK
jgi:hypothetical protein